ncbi:MAG: hypothetical protein NTZ56_07340 [Acidobacteria bacterium]|nr:hypothetical protein [Acidobacteriota bacterium]
MKVFRTLALLAVAASSQAATVTWTEYKPNGTEIASGTFTTTCGLVLSFGDSCAEPSAFSATGVHFSMTGSTSARNIDGLNTELIATAVVTSLDGTRGMVAMQWDQLFYPDFFYSYDPTVSVVDSYTLTGGFALASPAADSKIVASKTQQTIFGPVSFPSLVATSDAGPTFSVGPETKTYAPNFGNGLWTTVRVSFQFLGASITAGDAMDIPVSTSTSVPASPVPEPAAWWLAGGALLAMRRLAQR